MEAPPTGKFIHHLQAFIMAASRFVFTTALSNVVCSVTAAKHIVQFGQGAPRATVSTEQAFKPPGIHSFEVFMKDKKVKTAVGFLSERKTTEYMRDTPIGEFHISMGGAGWIHPKEIAAEKKYKEGDTVKVEVDFDQSLVRFYVNAEFAGQDKWEGGDSAYPSISADGGPCELEVAFSD